MIYLVKTEQISVLLMVAVWAALAVEWVAQTVAVWAAETALAVKAVAITVLAARVVVIMALVVRMVAVILLLIQTNHAQYVQSRLEIMARKIIKNVFVKLLRVDRATVELLVVKQVPVRVPVEMVKVAQVVLTVKVAQMALAE